jgi:hypothetical protein
MKSENGILVKYYGDDNLIGTITEHTMHTPMYAEIRRIADFKMNKSMNFTDHLKNTVDTHLELNDLWTRTWQSNKIFSVKMTALVQVDQTGDYVFSIDPSPVTVAAMPAAERPPVIHNTMSEIEIYVDGVHVCPNGQEEGTITLESGPARWYHLQVELRVYDNTVTTTSGIPEISVKWGLQGGTKETINYTKAIAEDVYDNESWSYATKLRKYNYPL